jgi:hypothetical protein
MDSGMIGKVEKAHRYARERDRIEFSAFACTVRGDNDNHSVTLEDGRWQCTCDYFSYHSVCAHTMTIELVLAEMLPARSQAAVA